MRDRHHAVVTPPRLLLITDDAATRRHGRGVVATLGRALDPIVITDADAVAVVVRAKHLDDDALAARCRAVRDVVRPSGCRVFVHGRPTLVGPLGLDGCHLPDGPAPRMARLHLPPGACLGVSSHPRFAGDRCAFAVDDGVDYATWSPIFAPASKADDRPPLGLAALAGHHTPVLALGGIDAARAAACVAAGARGVAVLGAVFGAARPDVALRDLLAALAISWRRRRRGHREAA
jgi:thiamine-phosphate pyrophosphorylase